MSIIYEALKKAESREGKKINDLGPVKDLPLKVGKLSKNRNKKKIKSVLGILLFILVFVILFLWNNFSSQFKILSISDGLNNKKNNLGKLSNFLKTNNKESSEYTLNGIVYDNGKSSAVINGRLIKEGDKINDFVVNNISQETVKLINTSDNKELVLTLPF